MRLKAVTLSVGAEERRSIPLDMAEAPGPALRAFSIDWIGAAGEKEAVRTARTYSSQENEKAADLVLPPLNQRPSAFPRSIATPRPGSLSGGSREVSMSCMG